MHGGGGTWPRPRRICSCNKYINIAFMHKLEFFVGEKLPSWQLGVIKLVRASAINMN